MYGRLDGAGHRFGDVSVRAVTSDVEGTSVYASLDTGAPGRVVIIAINKTGGQLTAGVRIAHPSALGTAQVFQLTSASASPQAAGTIEPASTNAYSVALPAYSVSALVIDP